MRTVLFMLILVGTSNVASGQAFRLNDEDGWSPLPNPPPARPKDCGMHGGPLQEKLGIKRRPFAEIG